MALTEAQKASQKQLRSIDGFVSTLKPYRISLSQLFFTWNYRVVHRGVNQLSPSSQTLLSGFLAVISVNLIIGYYIFMALKEPANSTHQPDPTFVSQAKASISQSVAGGSDNGQASLKED
ncbi:uncharacterized protein LOC18431944 isoform X2 [Amborella trichopoda]|uniref:uncharacterized protein LOC18431944 isoform X2 n=1 Tax=Amborella trichopoda TaxID=13333 RepID=UPI0005D37438|nr:uncharacterized protein LOC18431944 isoform X2 [Amborella trichopoda]|eukprot:XP_011622499.1 uncharacterized protein LOC18431944 isoform X2 [Amborella trichopoda]